MIMGQGKAIVAKNVGHYGLACCLLRRKVNRPLLALTRNERNVCAPLVHNETEVR